MFITLGRIVVIRDMLLSTRQLIRALGEVTNVGEVTNGGGGTSGGRCGGGGTSGGRSGGGKESEAGP